MRPTKTTFVIAEIVGGYDDITSDGTTAIDLAARFGESLTGAVYLPEGGEAVTLSAEELSGFIGSSSGTLKLIFEKEGFRKSEIEVGYTVN